MIINIVLNRAPLNMQTLYFAEKTSKIKILFATGSIISPKIMRICEYKYVRLNIDTLSDFGNFPNKMAKYRKLFAKIIYSAQ